GRGQRVRHIRLRRSGARAGDHTARDAESHATGRQCDRWTHYTPCGLREESTREASDRTGVWLAEDDRVAAQGETARPRQGRLALRVRECGLQSDPAAQAAAEARLTHDDG